MVVAYNKLFKKSGYEIRIIPGNTMRRKAREILEYVSMEKFAEKLPLVIENIGGSG